jgi:hypothetical protein
MEREAKVTVGCDWISHQNDNHAINKHKPIKKYPVSAIPKNTNIQFRWLFFDVVSEAGNLEIIGANFSAGSNIIASTNNQLKIVNAPIKTKSQVTKSNNLNEDQMINAVKTVLISVLEIFPIGLINDDKL